MEAEERPRKLRKLSYDHDTTPESLLDATISHAQTESAHNAEVEPANRVSAEASVEIGPGQQTAHSAWNCLQVFGEQPDPSAASQTLSKSQMKKLKRQAEWEAGREDRKLRRKEKTKEKKARKRAQREEAAQAQAQHAEEVGLQGDDAQVQPGRPKGLPPRVRRQRVPIALVIDCGFDELMVEKERISLGSQLTRAYSDNSKAPYQAHLYVSSWTPESELRKRFEGLMKGMYRNWKGIVFTEKDFVAASEEARQEMRGGLGAKLVGAFEKYAQTVRSQTNGNKAHIGEDEQCAGGTQRDGVAAEPAKHSEHDGDASSGMPVNSSKEGSEATQQLKEASEVIYLTSDSPYTLTELKPYHTYIIGGLVDKNRHKGICYKTALDKNASLAAKATTKSTNGSEDAPNPDDSIASQAGEVKEIKTAKLPIGEYMSMTARHVLATNHVVEIMLKWLETGDWGEAFLRVVPKRKGGVLKRVNAEQGGEEEEDTAPAAIGDPELDRSEAEANAENEESVEGTDLTNDDASDEAPA